MSSTIIVYVIFLIASVLLLYRGFLGKRLKNKQRGLVILLGAGLLVVSVYNLWAVFFP